MGIDKITISLDGVKSHAPFNHVLWPLTDDWRYIEDKENEYVSRYVNDSIEGIHVEYMPNTKKGYLSLDLNIPGLLFGDNVASIYCYNMHDLLDILNHKLNGVVALCELPHLRFWRVSKVEINTDIIGGKEYIDKLYTTISKVRPPKYFKLDRRYKDLGTIYFHNRKTRKDSTTSIKFYYKLKERADTGIRSRSSYYDCKDLINLRLGEEVLRYEVKMRRDDLKRMYQRYTSSIVYKDKRIDYIPRSKFDASFEDIFDYDFQLFVLNEYIKALHLDRTITTRIRLFEVIDDSKTLSPKYKKNMKEGLRFLNGEIRRIKLSSRTLANYIAVLDEWGYHYIYSDAECPGVSPQGIIAGLPTIQRQINEFYKDGNIMTDAWYSKATPEIMEQVLSRRRYNKELRDFSSTE